MASKHTPGPWIFDPANCGRSLMDGFGLVAKDTDGADPGIHIEIPDGDDEAAYETAQANARLCAAAPDLLAAVDAILLAHYYDMGRTWTISPDLARQLHAATAKATKDAAADYDPTPYCAGCRSMTKSGCDCGPIAEND